MTLKRDVTPENGPVFAADIVASTARITGDTLDYSVASLAVVDRIIENFRKDGQTIDSMAETLFCFGCYVGEVLVRNAGGRWLATPEEHLPVLGMRITVELPNSLCNPIAKVFKRMHNGMEDHLPYFYVAFTQKPTQSIEVRPESGKEKPLE
ncbi:MAG: hypothetical protein AB7K24_25670 [Gemmataceae bacterium]